MKHNTCLWLWRIIIRQRIIFLTTAEHKSLLQKVVLQNLDIDRTNLFIQTLYDTYNTTSCVLKLFIVLLCFGFLMSSCVLSFMAGLPFLPWLFICRLLLRDYKLSPGYGHMVRELSGTQSDIINMRYRDGKTWNNNIQVFIVFTINGVLFALWGYWKAGPCGYNLILYRNNFERLT